MTPAFGLTLTEIMSDPELMQSDDVTKLHNRMERSMMEDPTGHSLFYTRVAPAYSGGKNFRLKECQTRVFIPIMRNLSQLQEASGFSTSKDYEEMNRFFIDSMGWDKKSGTPSGIEKMIVILLFL